MRVDARSRGNITSSALTFDTVQRVTKRVSSKWHYFSHSKETIIFFNLTWGTTKIISLIIPSTYLQMFIFWIHSLLFSIIRIWLYLKINININIITHFLWLDVYNYLTCDGGRNQGNQRNHNKQILSFQWDHRRNWNIGSRLIIFSRCLNVIGWKKIKVMFWNHFWEKKT